MSKTLDEQFRDYCLREGFNDGKEFGIKQGSVETTVNLTVEHVRNLMTKQGLDADTAMDTLGVPEDIREEVRKSL